MSTDIYKKLARHLDSLPGGFPSTESGVELRILRRLFSPEQALLATHLTIIPEREAVVARRAGLAVAECARCLDQMSDAGLIFSYRQGRDTYYMAAHFVIGIWEYHVNKLDPELIKDMREYIPSLFNIWQAVPQLRTIPVGRSLQTGHEVMAYEQAEAIIKAHERILVAPCICRREHAIMGQGCGKLEEACLVFGAGVPYYQKNGLGRPLGQEEALEILKLADKAGLVLQPSNAQKVINICCCCGCCCHVLKNIKRHIQPAEIVVSSFVVQLDEQACTGCGICEERCQVEALAQVSKKGKAALEAERCIGCGLCVTTCSGNALTLKRKPQTRPVPRNVVENYLNLARARGKMKPHQLVWMQLKSKMDRLLAKS